MLVQATVSGVDGAIGSTYNVNGRRARQIFELAQQGNVSEAYKIQHETNDIIQNVLAMGIYPTLKEILKRVVSMVVCQNAHLRHSMKRIVPH